MHAAEAGLLEVKASAPKRRAPSRAAMETPEALRAMALTSRRASRALQARFAASVHAACHVAACRTRCAAASALLALRARTRTRCVALCAVVARRSASRKLLPRSACCDASPTADGSAPAAACAVCRRRCPARSAWPSCTASRTACWRRRTRFWRVRTPHPHACRLHTLTPARPLRRSQRGGRGHRRGRQHRGRAAGAPEAHTRQASPARRHASHSLACSLRTPPFRALIPPLRSGRARHRGAAGADRRAAVQAGGG
jgi:hypothetical protein